MMVGVTDLHFPGVTGTIRPVNERQAAALRRTGWRPVETSAVPDVDPTATATGSDKPHEES